MLNCKNCGHVVEGNYCSHCRQSVDTARITWAEVMRQVRHATVDIDRGFLFTIREMALRPGHALRRYLEGKRVNYSNPFLFTLIMAGFTSLLFLSFDVPLPVRSINLERIEQLRPLVAQKYFILVGVCIMAMLSLGDRLVQRRSGLNPAELVVANTFQAGICLVITILMFPLIYFQDHFFPSSAPWTDVRQLLKVVIFGYLVLARYQLFHDGRQSKGHVLGAILLQVALTVLVYELVISKLIIKIL